MTIQKVLTIQNVISGMFIVQSNFLNWIISNNVYSFRLNVVFVPFCEVLLFAFGWGMPFLHFSSLK